jgi:class 3 adenylate cyclase
MECAVLFADVAGSTALYEVLGDESAFALVERCLATMSACTVDTRGRVVKTIGDAVMSVFAGADDAASAAAAMQFQVEQLGPPAGVRLGVRIGFHAGPVVEREGDVFGDSVNLASRLCDLASRGQIVTDRSTADHLSPLYRSSLRPLFKIPVKGKAAEVEVIELVWQADADDRTAIVSAPGSGGDAGRARLALEMGERQIEMGPQRRKVTVGRDLEADFAVRNPSVSRAHAMIERRREHFVLADHSLNGSFVSFEGRPEMRVHHEELTLVGRGCITFGEPAAEALQRLSFCCMDATSG